MQSEQINELAAALAKAQGQIESAKKDAANPFFKSKYSTLSSVWEACRDQLSKNGLAVIQTTCAGPEKDLLYTTLTHSSGQWICGTMSIKPVKDDPQGYGSALTYTRRYALSAIVGICPEDDDGNAASSGTKKVEVIDDKQAGTLKALIIATGSDLNKFKKAFEIKDVLQLPKSKYNLAIQALEKKAKKAVEK